MGISAGRLAELRGLLEAGAEHEFYSWPEWRRLRREVLTVDNCECQECKRRGVYSRASIVHHVRHLRDRPDLALSVYDGDSRQLEAVCKRCHEELHPDSQRQYAPSAPPLTPERWD
jgi:5-methylcytosine-specific restriction endonuclease McrA